MSFYLIAGVAAPGGLLFGYDKADIRRPAFHTPALALSPTMHG
jgi:hypothetical protein